MNTQRITSARLCCAIALAGVCAALVARPALAQTTSIPAAANAPTAAPAPTPSASTGAQPPATASPQPAAPPALPQPPASSAAPPVIPPALAAKLVANPVKFGQYSMRVPTSYSSMPMNGGGTMKHLYGWGILNPGAHTVNMIIVGDAPRPGDGSISFTAADIMPPFSVGAARERFPHGYHHSPIEGVTINGKKFARMSWSGAAKANGHITSGTLYINVRGDGSLVVVMCENERSNSVAALALQNAAVQTLTID